MNTKQKFNSLNAKSAWAYPKQKGNFEDVFKSALLFSEIPSIKNTNVETYFTANYIRYGISTDRHRMLAIPQMFGLITKDHLSYSQEKPTPVFKELEKYSFGSSEFNKIISEQLIKIKVKAIVDTKHYA